MVDYNVQVANNFYSDCEDYLLRVRRSWEEFSVVKSRRLKLFVDLRLAYECILKSFVAASITNVPNAKQVLRHVEGYRHFIARLEVEVFPAAPFELVRYGGQLDELPISLRYRVDCRDFIMAKEPFYYSTVGSDQWIDELIAQATRLKDYMGGKLASYSTIVEGEALWETVVKVQPNKYAP